LERLLGAPFGDDVVDNVRDKLLNKYPKLLVLLKLGAHGCAIITKDLYIKCPAITHYNENILKDYKIVDVTGAGIIKTENINIEATALWEPFLFAILS
jgi:sugar/nucleoside kinase (ribokinase family)